MKAGDIVDCLEYGIGIILGPCEIPMGVPEDVVEIFLANPEAWPTEKGWTVKLLEDDNMVLSVHERTLRKV